MQRTGSTQQSAKYVAPLKSNQRNCVILFRVRISNIIKVILMVHSLDVHECDSEVIAFLFHEENFYNQRHIDVQYIADPPSFGQFSRKYTQQTLR